MAIGDDKVRTLITLTKEDKAILEELAKGDNRNLSNYINTVLKKHIAGKLNSAQYRIIKEQNEDKGINLDRFIKDEDKRAT